MEVPLYALKQTPHTERRTKRQGQQGLIFRQFASARKEKQKRLAVFIGVLFRLRGYPRVDKYQALDEFWNRFNITAYDESSVPDDAEFPYITYSAQTSTLVDGPVALNASLWFYGPSWAVISQRADAISQYIGMGGIMSLYDGGALWVKRGTPFAQRMSDPDDDMIRRIVLNIEAEFISAD